MQTSGGLDAVKKDVQDLGKTAEQSGGGFNALQEIATGALRAIGTAAVDLAVKGLQSFAGAVQDGIKDAQENARIQAATAAVLKSTGNAAGTSAEHIADYASSLSDAAGQSLFGDDQIQQSTNLLLTFTEIKGKVLDAATAVSVDMAQALGGAPKDAAIQLGKALNDPVKGITALTRVGVSFTDEQKAQIQAMQEAGDMAGAQTVILNELNKEFGGQSKAAADATGGWSEFNGRMGEAREALGTAILPLLKDLAGVLLTDVVPIIESAAAGFGTLVEMIRPFIAQLQESIAGLLGSFSDANPMETFMGVAETLTPFIRDIQNAFTEVWRVLQTQVWPILQDLGTALFPLVGAAIQILAGFWTDVLVPSIQAFWSLLTNVVLPVIAALAGWLKDNLPGAIQAVADFLTNTLFPAFHAVYDFISANVIPILAQVAQWLIANVPVAIQAASDFFNTILVPALQAVWAFIQTNVLPIFGEISAWLSTTIPAATQTTSSFWSGTLLPALNSVWAFIQNFVVPLFTALVQLHLAVLGLAVRTLTAVWQNELLPALNSIWKFIQTNLGPIIDWLTVTILKPLWSILGDIYYTVLGSVNPVLTKLSSLVKDEVAHAFNSLSSFAGAAAGGLSSIGSAVSSVISWINDLVAKLNSVSVPDWLQGHSPPPMANWFSNIADSVKGVNAQLPTLAMNLAAQIGPSGQSVTNTASTRSFTYAPQYNGGGAVEGPMDLALANSLAGV